MRYIECLVFFEPMFGDQLGEESTIDSPRDIVPGGYGKKGACVVVESGGIIETCSFRCEFTKTHHALRTIQEPPRRPEEQTWIMSGKWREFAAEGLLV
jgi:hypothetical protein